MPLPFPVWSSTLVVYEYEYLLNTLRYLLYAESCLSGRAYIGEVLIQIWLKSMQN